MVRRGLAGSFFEAIDHTCSLVKPALSYCLHINSDSCLSAECNDLCVV